MIIGIWRAPLDKTRPLEDYIKFQNDVVVPEMKTLKGCLGIFNFHTDDEWGTVQLWESHEDDAAEDTSPQAQRINEKLMASGLFKADGHGYYKTFDIHNGFTDYEALKKILK